jgi:hypothetical protein
MRLAVLATLAGVALTAMTGPASADWLGYISHPLGFGFAAPGPMKVEKGTYTSPIAGQHSTIVFAFAEDNIEYKVVVVDMRVRKLLKRFLATPMRRSDFLLAIMFSRLIFTLGDIVVLLLFGWLVVHTRVVGSYIDLTAAIVLGAAAFAGIGMLVASRAQTLETVSGLMNLVMLPMWVFSGVFFSSGL